MSEWLPAVLSLVGSLIGAAITYGALGQRVKDHERRLTALDGPDGTEGRQWAAIKENATVIANTRGRLGLNGE